MTEIKPWQDRVKPGAFTGVKMEAMLAEIAELRAALAKSQPVEQGSPVAWRGWNGDTWVFTLWRDEMSVQLDWEPLFIHPARQPMSDEKIDEILDAAYTNAIATGKTNGGMAGETWNLIAARAIEAHIKGATE